jgi:hypothetical protein
MIHEQHSNPFQLTLQSPEMHLHNLSSAFSILLDIKELRLSIKPRLSFTIHSELQVEAGGLKWHSDTGIGLV